MTEPLLTRDPPRRAVPLQRWLPDPPADIRRAPTEPAQLRAMFPCGVVVACGRWEAGAALTFPFPPGVIDLTLTGAVLEVDEPRLLAFARTLGPQEERPPGHTGGPAELPHGSAVG